MMTQNGKLKIKILKIGYQHGSMYKHIVYLNGLGQVRKVVMCPNPVLILEAQACQRTISYFKASVYAA